MADSWSKEAAKVYRFLGQAYLQPPDRPYLEAVAAWCDELLAQQGGGALPAEVLEALETVRAALDGLTEERVQEIQEEFVRLFRGLSPRRSPPPPYESVYREGQLWGEATAAVQRLYRQWGIAPEERLGREPPDHLGLELQFMGYLCDPHLNQMKEKPEPLDVQRAFLEEHLDWVEGFRERVRAFQPHPFYEGLLRLTTAWLRLHREHLRTLET